MVVETTHVEAPAELRRVSPLSRFEASL